MLDVKNLGLLLIINGIFCFPITTGLFQFYRLTGHELDHQKKGEMRWFVYITLMVLSVWLYLIVSALFRR